MFHAPGRFFYWYLTSLIYSHPTRKECSLYTKNISMVILLCLGSTGYLIYKESYVHKNIPLTLQQVPQVASIQTPSTTTTRVPTPNLLHVSSPTPLPAPPPTRMTGSSSTPPLLLSLARTPTTETGGETMSAAESAQSPLRPPSPPTPSPRQPGEEEEEQCSVCHEALSGPQVQLDCCTHSLHLPCFCALRVRVETELRCPTCRAIATVDQSDREHCRSTATR